MIGKGREGKGREGKGRAGQGRVSQIIFFFVKPRILDFIAKTPA